MSLSGPLFGFFGSMGILQGTTIYAEYKRNGKQLGKAFDYSLRQPLFNKDQSLITQLMTAWCMIQNTLQLIPFEGSDGWHISSNLKFNHQMMRTMIKSLACGSLALTGLLGYLIYNAN